MIPLSTAMIQTGAADLVADLLVGVVGGAGPYALLAGLFVITAVFGQLISNMATALIVIPIAVAAAAELGVALQPVLMSVTRRGGGGVADPGRDAGQHDRDGRGRLPVRRLLEARPRGDGRVLRRRGVRRPGVLAVRLSGPEPVPRDSDVRFPSPMSLRPALAASIVAIALVMAVAPVAVAPVGDRAFADAPANLLPDGAGDRDALGAAAARRPHLPPPVTGPPPTHRAAATLAGSGAARETAFRSPLGGKNGRTVRLNLAGPRDYVAQTNLVQCVGASVQMMLNIIKPGANRTAAYQHRLQVQARSLSGPTPPGFVRSGAGVFGWAATLTLRGGGDYRVVGADTLRQAMRIAARAIHDQRRPVGLLVWRGRHAWVMSGYWPTVDRAARQAVPRHARLHPRPAVPLRRQTSGDPARSPGRRFRRGGRPPVRRAGGRAVDSLLGGDWRRSRAMQRSRASPSWRCRSGPDVRCAD